MEKRWPKLLCNEVQYLLIFYKPPLSAFSCAACLSPNRHTIDTYFIYIIYIIYKKKNPHDRLTSDSALRTDQNCTRIQFV